MANDEWVRGWDLELQVLLYVSFIESSSKSAMKVEIRFSRNATSQMGQRDTEQVDDYTFSINTGMRTIN